MKEVNSRKSRELIKVTAEIESGKLSMPGFFPSSLCEGNSSVPLRLASFIAVLMFSPRAFRHDLKSVEFPLRDRFDLHLYSLSKSKPSESQIVPVNGVGKGLVRKSDWKYLLLVIGFHSQR